MRNKKQSKFNWMAIWIVFLFVLSITNIHIALYKKEKIESFDVDGWTDVYVPNDDGLSSVFCNKEVVGCSRGYNCPDGGNYISYERKSNEVDNFNNQYFVFIGNGECTIKYNVNSLRLEI